MRRFIYTGDSSSLSYNSQTVVFNGEILTFYVLGKSIFEIYNLSYAEEDMGLSSITCDISFPPQLNVEFTFDWYVEFKGETFYNKSLFPPVKKNNSSHKYEYTLIFVSERENLKRYPFLNLVTTSNLQPRTEYRFSFNGDITQFADRFNLNLATYLGTRWQMIVSSGVTSLSQAVVCDNISLWDLLSKVYEIYGLKWRIYYDTGLSKMIIKILNEATDIVEISHEFEYGKGKGLVEIERINPSEDIITRLSGRGSTRNVPPNYFHPASSGFAADPDRNEHTDITYYTNILPKSYREYVRGWNGSGMTPPSTAYIKGVADKAAGIWNPVNYVDSSNVSLYGLWMRSLEDNEEIYPTIQGLLDQVLGRLDEVIDVEAVLNEDYDSVQSGSTGNYFDVDSLVLSDFLTALAEHTSDKQSEIFDITKANNKISYKIVQTPNIINGTSINYSTSISIKLVDSATSTVVETNTHTGSINLNTIDELFFDGYFEDVALGSYYIVIEVENTNGNFIVNVTTELNTITIQNFDSSDHAYPYKQTFDIWVKNIWGTSFQDQAHPSETEQEYVDRVWDPLIPSELTGEMTVMFSTGLLASEDYEFVVNKITYDTSKTNSHWKLTLIKSDAELEASDKYLPNKVINAVAGDYFFFINIILPQLYVYDSESRVEDYILTELDKVDKEQPTYTIKPSSVFCETFAEIDKVRVGSRIKLKNLKIIGATAVGFYIKSLTIDYSDDSLIPKWNIVVTDKVALSTNPISTLQGDVRRLTNNIYSSSQAIAEVVRQFDKYFLRKDGMNQSSESPTEFNQPISLAKNLLSKDFISGAIAGTGYGIYRDPDGSSVMEVDKLKIRKTLSANELIINQVSVFGGKYLYSAAGMEVSRVEETANSYKCFLDTKQGTILNQFIVDDQAFCQRFAPTDSSIINYYWRLVVAVGVDYIELSKSDADSGSSVPQVGDVIAQLGHRTNTARQSVLIIDQLSGGSVVQYAGIDSFSWSGKNYVGYGVNPTTGEAFLYAYGDMYFGDRDISAQNSTWLTFQKKQGEEVKKLYIKAVLEFAAGSTGLSNLSEWNDIDERIQKGEDAYDAIPLITPYYIDLTNENASVACDSDGVVIGDLPTSLAVIYYGSTEDTGWAFSGVFTGCTGTVNQSTGEISVATLTEDNATIVVSGSKQGKPDLSAVLTITKVKSGQNTKIYSVAPSVNVIKISKAGVITPASISCIKMLRDGSTAPLETTDKVLKYQINGGSIVSYTGALTITTSWVYVDFILYDDNETTILDKERVPVVIDGTDGSSGPTTALSVSKQVFRYNSSGNLAESGTWFVTCETFNVGGTKYYEWIINGTTVQNDTYLAYQLIPPALFTNMPVMYKVNVRSGSTSGPILASDSISIYGVKDAVDGTDGEDAYTVVLTNEAHSLPASSAGVVSSYSGSGTDIMCWLGSTPVPYGTGNSTFDVQISASGITSGSASTVSTYIRRIADHSAMTTDVAIVTFTIKVRNAVGAEVTITKKQSLTKSKGGSDADAQAAKEDMAEALGYASYAQMQMAISTNSTIIKDGLINTEILKAFSILTSNLSTSAGLGKRIRISKDSNALEMYDANNVIRAKISGEALSAIGSSGSTFSCTDKTGSISKYTTGEATGVYTYGGSNVLATITPIAVNNSISIPAIDISFTMSVLNPYDSAAVNCNIYIGNTLIGQAGFTSMAHGQSETIRIPATTLSLPVQNNYLTIEYEYFLYVEPSYPGFAVQLDATFVSGTGTINYVDNLTEVATNGIRSMWATDKYLEVSFNPNTSVAKIEARNGDYGFRITASGFEKMEDGVNWGPASI